MLVGRCLLLMADGWDGKDGIIDLFSSSDGSERRWVDKEMHLGAGRIRWTHSNDCKGLDFPCHSEITCKRGKFDEDRNYLVLSHSRQPHLFDVVRGQGYHAAHRYFPNLISSPTALSIARVMEPEDEDMLLSISRPGSSRDRGLSGVR